MATLMLVEEGLIELDGNVRAYLPELPEAYDAVTIRHLLTHTSGIKSDFKKRSQPPFFNESMLGADYQAGMGWFIGDENERGLVHHSGGVDGYAANIDRYLEEKLTVIVLCNIENTTAVSLTGALAEAYFAQK